MKTFSNEDIRNTEIHYRQFWKLDEGMGLHYGVWEKGIKTLAQAIIHTNVSLVNLAPIDKSHKVLDSGCGVGGSAIFLAKTYGCEVTGITLSDKQVATATGFATKNEVSDLVSFQKMDYTQTSFPDHHFDLIWAIESMQTASDKALFFKEACRILKPGGHILIADVFKVGNWDIRNTPVMQDMIHGWAMSDILSIPQLNDILENCNFVLAENRNVVKEIEPSIRRIRWASIAGMIGTKWYNLFHNATHFSKVHYKTGLAQYKAWKMGLWAYHLLAIEKPEI